MRTLLAVFAVVGVLIGTCSDNSSSKDEDTEQVISDLQVKLFQSQREMRHWKKRALARDKEIDALHQEIDRSWNENRRLRRKMAETTIDDLVQCETILTKTRISYAQCRQREAGIFEDSVAFVGP